MPARALADRYLGLAGGVPRTSHSLTTRGVHVTKPARATRSRAPTTAPATRDQAPGPARLARWGGTRIRRVPHVRVR